MRAMIIGIAVGALGVAAAAAIGVGTAAWATGLGPGNAAWASRDGDSDSALTGTTLDRATRAALDHTGGGEVTETETGDDGAAYGVEIRRPDARHVEVALDKDFRVVGEEADDGPDD